MTWSSFSLGTRNRSREFYRWCISSNCWFFSLFSSHICFLSVQMGWFPHWFDHFETAGARSSSQLQRRQLRLFSLWVDQFQRRSLYTSKIMFFSLCTHIFSYLSIHPPIYCTCLSIYLGIHRHAHAKNLYSICLCSYTYAVHTCVYFHALTHTTNSQIQSIYTHASMQMWGYNHE